MKICVKNHDHVTEWDITLDDMLVLYLRCKLKLHGWLYDKGDVVKK